MAELIPEFTELAPDGKVVELCPVYTVFIPDGFRVILCAVKATEIYVMILSAEEH